MPTTRLQSAGPSTPAPATPKPSSSRSTRRSSSRTPSQPQPQSHAHHRSADEIALEGAELIVHPHPHPMAHHHQTADELAAMEAEELLAGERGMSPLRSGRRRSVSAAASPVPSARGRSRGRGEVVVELPTMGSSAKKQYTPLKPGKSPATKTESARKNPQHDSSESLSTAVVQSAGRGTAQEPVVLLGEPVTSSEASEAEDEEETPAMAEAEDDPARADEEDSLRAGSSIPSARQQLRPVNAESLVDPDTSAAAPLSATLQSSIDRPNNTDPAVSDAAMDSSAIIPDESSDSPDDSSSPGSDSDDDDSDASDSESDADSATSSSSADTDSEVDSDEEEERLDKLLAAARLSAGKAAVGKVAEESAAGVVRMGEEDVLRLDADEEVADAPIPRMTISGLPAPSLVFAKDGSARAGPSRPLRKPGRASSTAQAGSSKGSSSAREPIGQASAPELDNKAYERPLSKREKANQPKKATPSELWSTLPSARADLLPQMKRDYQALALANSMDPKRFMKGGLKTGKVPESFAIGTVVEQSRQLQSTTLGREHKYRPGQLVQDVVADAGVSEYAKRKFGDLQWKRMENGRGKGWKKRTKW